MSLKSQKMAQAAYQRVEAHSRRADERAKTYRKEYRSFAREFPTLVHQCGLAQAVAFAQAKKKHHADYVADLAAVLKAIGYEDAGTLEGLAGQTRTLPVVGYVRLSRDSLDAAVWLKRYVEALFPEKDDNQSEVKPQ
jgi:CRISPR-associated protein Cmr5